MTGIVDRPVYLYTLAALLAAACTSLWGIDELRYAEPASGGGGAATSSTGAGGGSSSGQGGTGGASSGSGGQGGQGGQGGAGGGPLSCDAQYGAAPDYVLCDEDSGSCTFFVSLSGASCTQLCAALGGVCLGMINNGSEACQPAAVGPCNAAMADAICVCSLGCGQGPPCAGNLICVNGDCVNPN